jgi:hypothetical protein
MEKTMSTRTTGATDAQIEAAVERQFDDTSWADEAKAAYRGPYLDAMKHKSQYLVPPDHRIIGPDDLSALGRVLALAKTVDMHDAQWMGFSSVRADLARLAALLDGGDR